VRSTSRRYGSTHSGLSCPRLTLKVWDLETGKVLVTFTADGYVTACAVSPDGVRIVAGDALGRVHFLRLQNA
jgi:WD40 repeat protein